MTKYFLITILVLLAPPKLLAQEAETGATEEKVRDILYVTDQLRLSLYPRADDKSGSLQLLASGDRLAILQISGNYALVISPTGKQGWVKRGFLVSKPTSKLLLEEETKKNQQLSEEIEKLGNAKIVIDQYESDMDVLTENIRTLEFENEQARKMIDELERVVQQKAEMEAAIKTAAESNRALPIKVLVTTATNYWQYLVPMLLLFVLFGYLIGKMVVQYRIRKRFQGLKVW